jgi:hypothetical protein
MHMVAMMAMSLLGHCGLPRGNGGVGLSGLGVGRGTRWRDDPSKQHSEREHENKRVA